MHEQSSLNCYVKLCWARHSSTSAVHIPASTVLGRNQSSEPELVALPLPWCPLRTCPKALAKLTEAPAGAPELPAGLRGGHQPHISLELHASYSYLSMSYNVHPDS